MEANSYDPLDLPARTLMGPGPSDVHPRVLRAMNTPLVGHLDGAFLEVMDDVQEMLRTVFRTENQLTVPISGTGSAAMEAAFSNFVRPDDTVLVPTNGYFGGRMADMAKRAGGTVDTIDAPWGEPLAIEDVHAALDEHRPDVFAFVHAETSTGVLQHAVSELTDMAHDFGALVIADCVTSIGGVELHVDAWGIDVAYAGSQKCLSCPPGSSPLTVSEAARDRLHERSSPPRSWYLDLTMLDDYWGSERTYHHTAPITNVYAIYEALRLVVEEGLENRWDRHKRVATALVDGLEAVGMERIVEGENWLPSLTTVRVPQGIDDGTITNRLLEEYDIEIAGGLGDLSGEVLRIGCMGYSARPKNVLALVAALGTVLEDDGLDVDVAAALDVARSGLKTVQ